MLNKFRVVLSLSARRWRGFKPRQQGRWVSPDKFRVVLSLLLIFGCQCYAIGEGKQR